MDITVPASSLRPTAQKLVRMVINVAKKLDGSIFKLDANASLEVVSRADVVGWGWGVGEAVDLIKASALAYKHPKHRGHGQFL
jgi:hypothetical protein